MATSLGYTPRTPPDTAAQDDVDALVAALHDSGLLRALAGGVRAYPQLLAHALRAVDARTIRSVLELAGALRDLDPADSARLARGIRRARTEAARTVTGAPEGPVALLRRLRDPDTRRGIAAALAALAALGGSLTEK